MFCALSMLDIPGPINPDTPLTVRAPGPAKGTGARGEEGGGHRSTAGAAKAVPAPHKQAAAAGIPWLDGQADVGLADVVPVAVVAEVLPGQGGGRVPARVRLTQSHAGLFCKNLVCVARSFCFFLGSSFHPCSHKMRHSPRRERASPRSDRCCR